MDYRDSEFMPTRRSTPPQIPRVVMSHVYYKPLGMAANTSLTLGGIELMQRLLRVMYIEIYVYIMPPVTVTGVRWREEHVMLVV